MKYNTDEIKISLSNGTLTYEITINKFAINCNTKKWLLEQIEKNLEEIIGVKDEQRDKV